MKKESPAHYKRITADARWTDLRPGELWQYRELILLFTKRSFTVRYRQMVGGWLWIILIPLFNTLIGYLTFGGIAKLGTDGTPPILFYLTGTSIWSFFTVCITKNADLFRENAPVFSKVYFPRLTMSLSYVFAGLIELAINMAFVAALVIGFAVTGQLTVRIELLLLLPVLLLLIGTVGMSFGIIIAALTTKYRDFSNATPFVIALWMPITPVMYPLSEITSPLIRFGFMINPLSGFVELFRYILFGRGEILWGNLLWGVVFAVGLLALSLLLFRKAERTFADTI